MGYHPDPEGQCLYFHEYEAAGGIVKGACSYKPGKRMLCYGRCHCFATEGGESATTTEITDAQRAAHFDAWRRQYGGK